MQVQDKIYIGIGGLFILYALANYTYGQPHAANKELAEVSPKPVKIIAVGDINLGRQTGQKILAGEIDYPFQFISDYLRGADITFGNLESQLADLDGETQSPTNEYRFAGPPEGAQTLANAGFDIVSVANNHMWDYGQARLFETIDNLERVSIKYTGASKATENLYQPVIMEVNNQKIAWFAVTAILNGYEKAGATDYVAWADDDRLIAAIKQLKLPPPPTPPLAGGELDTPPLDKGRIGMSGEASPKAKTDGVDWIIVSMHRGVEYDDTPSDPQAEFAHQIIDAGADIVIGHHPHVPQGIEEYTTKLESSPPAGGGVEGGGSEERKGIIFYSLGNFAFWQPFDYWTQHSFAAEITLYPDRKFSYTTVSIDAGWQPQLTENEEEKNNLTQHLSDLANKF